MVAWAEAMAVTVAIAVPAGAVLGMLPRVESALRPVIEFLRPLPSVVLVPLVLLIVQDDVGTEVVVIVFAAVWPVLINTVYGLREVDPEAKETLRSFGFGPLAVTWRVSLPSAAPFIATGVRLASSVAIILDIGAGYITGRISGPGLGAFIADYSSGAGNLPIILAATIWAGILGLVLDRAIVWAEHRLLRWNHLRLVGVNAP
jgi:NitT/TauT family transport system permease protein